MGAEATIEPRVLVLLATFDGRLYLPAQLDSILAQHDVDVRVLISDDGSTDGTVDYLRERSAADDRLMVLPSGEHAGAAGNFYRLLSADDAVSAEYDLVALSDQDDVWSPTKLADQVRQLRAHSADGVSSNVLAFDDSGKEWLIRKDYPQRRYDYLLESPGPGCSFLLTPRLVALVRDTLRDVPDAAAMEFHDWLIYGVCRSRGWTWQIGAEPTVRYRQHGANTMGANTGVGPKADRLGLIRQRWHRGEAARMAGVGVATAPTEPARADLQRMLDLLTSTRWRDRWRLAARAGQLRRRPLHRLAIAGLITIGLW